MNLRDNSKQNKSKRNYFVMIVEKNRNYLQNYYFLESNERIF